MEDERELMNEIKRDFPEINVKIKKGDKHVVKIYEKIIQKTCV